ASSAVKKRIVGRICPAFGGTIRQAFVLIFWVRSKEREKLFTRKEDLQVGCPIRISRQTNVLS
ncbi:MAG: hypothetical protein KAW02_05840, partial [candidate division Zixibacteria bacterium]|nr:hypothetical protein [candidate division Zixibacteria bacterium]